MSVYITWSGHEVSFLRSKDLIIQRLNEEAIPWKRGDGTLPFQVHVHAEFVDFDLSLLMSRCFTSPKTLSRIPSVCHLFFLELQDIGYVKNEVRPQLSEWLANIDSSDYNDCLIIVDASQIKETKLRGSTIDKLRSDFPKVASRLIHVNLTQKKGHPLLVRSILETLMYGVDKVARFLEYALKVDRENCFSCDFDLKAYFINELQMFQLYSAVKLFDLALVHLEEMHATLSLLITNFAGLDPKPIWFEKLFAIELDVDGTYQKMILHPTLSNLDQILAQFFQNFDPNDPEKAFLVLNGARLILLACSISLSLQQHNMSLKSVQQPISSLSSAHQQICENILFYGDRTLQSLIEEQSLAALSYQHLDQSESLIETSLQRLVLCCNLLSLANEFGELYDVQDVIESLCKIWKYLCLEAGRLLDYFSTFPLILAKIWQRMENNAPEEMKTCFGTLQLYKNQYVKWHESALALLKHKAWNKTANMIGLNLARFYVSENDKSAAASFYTRLLRSCLQTKWSFMFNCIFGEAMNNQLVQLFPTCDKFTFLLHSACLSKWTSSINMFIGLISDQEAENRVYLEASFLSIDAVEIHPKTNLLPPGSNIDLLIRLENQFPAKMPISSQMYCCLKHFANETEARCDTSATGPDFDQSATSPGNLLCCNESALWGRQRHSDVIDRLNSLKCEDSDHVLCWPIDFEKNGNDQQFLIDGFNQLKATEKPILPGLYIVDHLHIHVGNISFYVSANNNIDSIMKNSFQIDSIPFSIEISQPKEKLYTGITQKITLKIINRNANDEAKNNETDSSTVQILCPDKNIMFIEDEVSNAHETFLKMNKKETLNVAVFVGLNGKNEAKQSQIVVKYKSLQWSEMFVFYPLLSWTFETKWIGAETLIIEYTVFNHSSTLIRIQKARLEMWKRANQKNETAETNADCKEINERVVAELLNKTDMLIMPEKSHNLVWRVRNDSFDEGAVHFVYTLGNNEQNQLDTFECWAGFLFSNFPVIEANCQIASESIVCRVDSPCDFVISLKANDSRLKCAELLVKLTLNPFCKAPQMELGKTIQNEQKALFWSTAGSNNSVVSNSGSCDNTVVVKCNVTLKENCLGQAFFRLAPRQVGFLPCPFVDVEVLSPEDLACRTYCRSKGKQIHVLAPMTRAKTDVGSKNR